MPLRCWGVRNDLQKLKYIVMKKNEKVLLIGGAAVAGVLLIVAASRRPATSTFRPYVLQNSQAQNLAQDVAVVTPAAGALTNLFTNIFGSSNSGTTQSTNGTSSTMYDPTDETMSGLERSGAIH